MRQILLIDPTSIYKRSRQTVSARTLREYNRYPQQFIEWLKRQNLKPTTSNQNMNVHLTQFAVAQSENQQGGWTFHRLRGENIQLAFFMPSLRGKLALMEQILQRWNILCPSTPFAICVEQAAYLIASDLFMRGYQDIPTDVLLSMDCYLRIGDLWNLNKKNVYH